MGKHNTAHHSFWHFLSKRRRHRVNHDERELLVSTTVSLAGAVLAGYLLEIHKDTLASVAGVFLILPGIFDLGGSVAGAMGAKLTHGYKHNIGHLKRFFVHSVGYSLGVICVASLILGFLGALVASLLFSGDLLEVYKISVIACLISGLVGLPIVGGLSVSLWKRGVDPDNIIGPIETSFFDSFTVITLIIAIWIVA